METKTKKNNTNKIKISNIECLKSSECNILELVCVSAEMQDKVQTSFKLVSRHSSPVKC